MAGTGPFLPLRESQVARNSGDIPVWSDSPFSDILKCPRCTGRTIASLDAQAASWQQPQTWGAYCDWLLCLLSRKLLWIFFSYLPGNFALKNGGDWKMKFLWSPFHTKWSMKNPWKVRGKFGAKFGAKSGDQIEKFGELSFCSFSDLMIGVHTEGVVLFERACFCLLSTFWAPCFGPEVCRGVSLRVSPKTGCVRQSVRQSVSAGRGLRGPERPKGAKTVSGVSGSPFWHSGDTLGTLFGVSPEPRRRRAPETLRRTLCRTPPEFSGTLSGTLPGTLRARRDSCSWPGSSQNNPPSKNPSKNPCPYSSPYKASSKNPSKKHLLWWTFWEPWCAAYPVLPFLGFSVWPRKKASNLPRMVSHCRTHKRQRKYQDKQGNSLLKIKTRKSKKPRKGRTG